MSFLIEHFSFPIFTSLEMYQEKDVQELERLAGLVAEDRPLVKQLLNDQIALVKSKLPKPQVSSFHHYIRLNYDSNTLCL